MAFNLSKAAEMFKKLSLLFFILGFSLFFSVGCGFETEKLEAEDFVDSYFDSIDNKEYDTLLSFYSDKAFGVISSDKALWGMKKALRSFGSLESYELKQKSFLIRKDQYGIFTAKLNYKVVYKKMKTKEHFAISKGRDNDTWIITSHTIDRIVK